MNWEPYEAGSGQVSKRPCPPAEQERAILFRGVRQKKTDCLRLQTGIIHLFRGSAEFGLGGGFSGFAGRLVPSS
jgi:hypothetical protein